MSSAGISKDLKYIRDFVCDYYDVTAEDLASKKRDRALVVPRKVFGYLASTNTSKSLAEIGSLIKRDHTMIIYYKNKVRDDISVDKAFNKELIKIEGLFYDTVVLRIAREKKEDIEEKAEDVDKLINRLATLESMNMVVKNEFISTLDYISDHIAGDISMQGWRRNKILQKTRQEKQRILESLSKS